MILTTSNIVSQVSKLGALSSNQAGLNTSDILEYANLAMSELLTDIVSSREDYLLFTDAITIIANQDTYRIPYRAIAGTARHVWFVQPSGSRQRLYPKTPENIEDYSQTDSAICPDGVYIYGNSLVLLPPPSKAATLEVMYPFNPNQLVDQSTTTTIQAISGNILTLQTTPTAFASGNFDIIDNLSGSGIIAYDQPCTFSGASLTFINGIPSNVKVGQYVALAGQSPVPMLPEVAHPLLLNMTVMQIEMMRGNQSRIKTLQPKIEKMHETLMKIIGQSRIASMPHTTGGNQPFLPVRPY